jgi:tetratricopeptide (TPR) repeat protein
VASNQPSDRLDSWKAIAAYLRRTERTARRWERTEGLPVHRLQHHERSSIYAFKSELDAWLAARGAQASSVDDERQASTHRRAMLAVAATGLLVVLGTAAYWSTRERSAEVAETGQLSSDSEATRHFLRGIGFSRNPGRSQIESAIAEFRAALERDPDFGEAHGALAIAYVACMFFGEEHPKKTMALARDSARKALALDSQFASHMALAGVSHWHDFDHVAAESHFHAAIAAAPGEAAARSWYSEYLIEMLRFEEALAANRAASEREPGWLEVDIVRGNILLFQQRPDEAIPIYIDALKREPSYGLSHYFLGYAYLATGRDSEAVREFELANQAMGDVPFSMAALGFARARAGQRPEAEHMLREFQRNRDAGYYPAFAFAMVYAGLGNREQALDWLERAADEGLVGYYLPSVELTWNNLRDDARFRRVLTRLRLPERT